MNQVNKSTLPGWPGEEELVEDSDPPCGIFQADGEWWWCWWGEIWAVGPYPSRAEVLEAVAHACR